MEEKVKILVAVKGGVVINVRADDLPIDVDVEVVDEDNWDEDSGLASRALWELARHVYRVKLERARSETMTVYVKAQDSFNAAGLAQALYDNECVSEQFEESVTTKVRAAPVSAFPADEVPEGVEVYTHANLDD